MSNQYTKDFSKELSELTLITAMYQDVSEAITLAKKLIKPLYYQQENRLRLDRHNFSTFRYHQMQTKLMNLYFEFHDYKDEDWKNWIKKTSQTYQSRKTFEHLDRIFLSYV